MGIFAVFSVIGFLCGKKSGIQKKRKERIMESSEKKLLSKINSNISSKTHFITKMISWRKEEEKEVEEEEEEEVVWRKTIIMGERCRPVNFSGSIVYDSEGNLLPHNSNRLRRLQTK